MIFRCEFVGLVEGEGAVIRGETAMVSKIERAGAVRRLLHFVWRDSQIVRVMVDVEVEAIRNGTSQNQRGCKNTKARLAASHQVT